MAIAVTIASACGRIGFESIDLEHASGGTRDVVVISGAASGEVNVAGTAGDSAPGKTRGGNAGEAVDPRGGSGGAGSGWGGSAAGGAGGAVGAGGMGGGNPGQGGASAGTSNAAGGIAGTAGPEGGVTSGFAGFDGIAGVAGHNVGADAGAGGTGGTLTPVADLRLSHASSDLLCGVDGYTFSAVGVGAASDTVFSLSNDGAAELDLVGAPPVEIVAADPSEFLVTSFPSTPVGPGGQTEFAVAYAPHVTGLRQATMVITSNDPDESPCQLSLAGSGSAVGGPDNDTWQSTVSMNTSRFGFGSVISNGYLYAIGGCRQQLLTRQIISAVEYAPLNANGTVGPWSDTTALPVGVCHAAAFAYGGHVFVAGGTTSDSQTDAVQVAPIQTDGSLGAWTTTAALPDARVGVHAALRDGIAYLVGGRTDSGSANEVLMGRLGPAGTVVGWTQTTPLLYGRRDHGLALVNGRIYALGGWNSGGVLQNEFAAINSDGTLGTWTETTPLPATRSSAAGFAYGDHVYLVGGDDGNATGQYDNGVFALVSSDGTLGPWSVLSNDFATARTGARALVYDNRVIILGGWNQLLSNYADVQVTTLL